MLRPPSPFLVRLGDLWPLREAPAQGPRGRQSAWRWAPSGPGDKLAHVVPVATAETGMCAPDCVLRADLTPPGAPVQRALPPRTGHENGPFPAGP